MAEPVSIRQALDLRPEDALRAFRARDELKLSVSYRDLAPEEHARAFTVAKIAKTDLLADIGGSLDRALKEGQSFETWKAGILPTLQQHGWWGVVTDETLTGTSRRVFVGDRRLRTIFQTNMRVSHAAGQWARIQQLKATRPFLRYVGILDQRIRPEHAAWHGIILPVDHPFWRSHYPPNGWNCRCQVLQLSQRDLDRRGWKVTTEDELARIAPMVPIDESGFGAPDAGGHRPQRAVRPGVDAGWDYHVGAESLRGLMEKAFQSVERLGEARLDKAGLAMLEELAADPMRRRALIETMAKKVRTDPKFNATLPIGEVSAANAQAVRDATGIEIEGFQRIVETSALRHVYKNHGDAVVEAARGQVAIIADDFALIDQIVSEATYIGHLGRPNSRQPERFLYRAVIGGTVYEYVEVLAPVKRRVSLKTLMRKAIDPR